MSIMSICEAGMYVDVATQQCVKCPKGTYRNKQDRMTECIRCPQDTTTEHKGATSQEECLNPCLVTGRGRNICPSNAACVYHEEADAFACECLPNYVMKISTSECLRECLSGYELDANRECVPCQRGYFRSRGMPACQQCVPGKTTPDVAATSEQECWLDICQPGMYVDTSTLQCVICPKGTYQDKQDRMTECIRCPQYTTTEHEGATSQQECSNPCFVNDRERICQSNAACVYHEETDTFACECLPHYAMKHSSAECLHVCDGYCQNGGTCKVNPHTFKPQCVCPAIHYGDICTQKSELVYVASGIAGAVIILILLILLIWKIFVRSKRKRKLQKIPEPHTRDFQTQYSAYSQTNSFHEAPAPCAESFPSSHHSARYSKDNEGFEMTNFSYLPDSANEKEKRPH